MVINSGDAHWAYPSSTPPQVAVSIVRENRRTSRRCSRANNIAIAPLLSSFCVMDGAKEKPRREGVTSGGVDRYDDFPRVGETSAVAWI